MKSEKNGFYLLFTTYYLLINRFAKLSAIFSRSEFTCHKKHYLNQRLTNDLLDIIILNEKWRVILFAIFSSLYLLEKRCVL